MSDPTAESPTRRSIRSFVLRQGRFTEAQKRAFETHWPRFGLQSSQGLFDPHTVFPGAKRLVLEIGFGMGHTLAELALRHRDTGFIGIEVHRPGVGKLLELLDTHDLDNVRVYCEDAIEVLASAIAASSLDELLLFFPDPWHKKRHNKRRIVQPAFAELVRTRLKPGGVLHMATDWAPYAEHMLDVLGTAPGFENVATSGTFVERPPSRPETRFEQRGRRLGHTVRDLMFRRID